MESVAQATGPPPLVPHSRKTARGERYGQRRLRAAAGTRGPQASSAEGGRRRRRREGRGSNDGHMPVTHAARRMVSEAWLLSAGTPTSSLYLCLTTGLAIALTAS